jgi:hypothetical protein
LRISLLARFRQFRGVEDQKLVESFNVKQSSAQRDETAFNTYDLSGSSLLEFEHRYRCLCSNLKISALLLSADRQHGRSSFIH